MPNALAAGLLPDTPSSRHNHERCIFTIDLGVYFVFHCALRLGWAHYLASVVHLEEMEGGRL